MDRAYPEPVRTYRYNKLRGRIVEKYNTQAEFAKALGISKNAFSRKMKGKSMFSQSDIEACCDLLEIRKDEIGAYFFS